MGIKFANNASTNITHTLTADALSVSVTPGTGSMFPSIVEGTDYFYATLAGNSGLEIVKVTKRVLDTMTIERAQDGTDALVFNQGDLFELRIVAADFEDTFSHVETTLEDTVSNLEATVEDAVDTLTASVNSKMSSYLPLKGGTLTGTLVGTAYEQMCSSIDQSVTPSENKYGSSIRFLDKNKVPVGRMTVFRRAGGTTVLRLSSLLPDGENGTHLDILTGDGIQKLQLTGNDVLTSAGGTLTGVINTNGWMARGTTNASFIAITAGASTAENGAGVFLYGKDEASKGLLRLRAANGTRYTDLLIYPDGSANINGNTILTSAGGTLTGSFSVKLPNIDVKTKPSTAQYGNVIRFTDKNDSFFAMLQPVQWSNGGNALRFIVAKKDGSQGGSLTIEEHGNGTTRNLTFDGNSVLTSAGGNIKYLNFADGEQGGGYCFAAEKTFYFGGRGADGRDSSFVRFYGLDNSSSPGSFMLSTRVADGNWGPHLFGDTNGILWWNNGRLVTLVSSWNNGFNWCRKYSDGFIMQGGYTQIPARDTRVVTVNMHIPFTSGSSYVPQISLYRDFDSDEHWGSIGGRNATAFNVHSRWLADGTGFFWTAFGY